MLERITGKPTEFFVTGPMKDGTEREPFARSAYCQLFSREVIEIAFVDHALISMSGSSPDGLVGDDGCIEIKCQQPAKHLEVLNGSTIDDAHMQQMQWLLACSGRQWCDFINFNPDFPENMQFVCRRVERDDVLISQMEIDVSDFLREVADEVDGIVSKYGNPRKAAA